jgi:hypothetical protein
LSAQVLALPLDPDHPIQALDIGTRVRIEHVADECANQLSLYHHGRHRISDRKLPALTAVHNFHIRRADATTAAERLFGRAPSPVFEQVLARVPLPPRVRADDDPHHQRCPT